MFISNIIVTSCKLAVVGTFSSSLLPHLDRRPCTLHSNKCLFVSTLGCCGFISTVIPLSPSCTVKDEWPLSQWALLPVLLPALPQPHRSQARLPAPWAHVRLSSRPRGKPCCARGHRDIQPAGTDQCISCRGRGCGGAMEAPPNGASRVSVLAERAGHDRGVPHSIQPRQQSRLHVHSLCS